MDYTGIEKLVRRKAKEIAGVTNLVIKFSNKMKKSHALCYWQETPQAIHFNKTFVDLNIDKPSILNELIIHECIHLIPGYNRHNRKFMEKCRHLGIEQYGYSENYNDVKPTYASHCTKCDDYKTYYVKPRVTCCKHCKGELRIFENK